MIDDLLILKDTSDIYGGKNIEREFFKCCAYRGGMALEFFIYSSINKGYKEIYSLLVNKYCAAFVDELGHSLICGLSVPVSESGQSTLGWLRYALKCNVNRTCHDGCLGAISTAIQKNALAHLVLLLDNGFDPFLVPEVFLLAKQTSRESFLILQEFASDIRFHD